MILMLLFLHNTKTVYAIYTVVVVVVVVVFSAVKIKNFQMKKKNAVKIENFNYFFFLIFLIFAQNIDCGYTLEPPRSNKYPLSIFWSNN